MLEERDYTCEDLSAGHASCDILAIDPRGIAYAVEVKDRVLIDIRAVRKQARTNAKRHTRWMLMCHIPDSKSWIVERQGERPCVWHERGGVSALERPPYLGVDGRRGVPSA